MSASTIYSLEPTPRGQVMLKTTAGDVLIELFARECPQAVFNFCQLGIDGYYDQTIFHRVVKDVLIQGGDPTGTGHGGAAYDNEPFDDEIHSRLKFRRRGLLAMAGKEGQRNSNGSQFFFTLGPCEGFNGKHTIFGRVAGNESMFRLQTMGEAACDADERPLQPHRILSFKIIQEPFDEPMEKSEAAKPSVAAPLLPRAPPAKGSRGGGAAVGWAPSRSTGVLSFGNDEEEEDANQLLVTVKRVKTVHDTKVLKTSKTKDAGSGKVQNRSESVEEDESEESEGDGERNRPLHRPTSNSAKKTPDPEASAAVGVGNAAEQARDAKLADRLAAFKARMAKKAPL